MFTGIALTTEKKRLARLADTLEARQKELTIKEDLCDRLTTKLKAAEATTGDPYAKILYARLVGEVGRELENFRKTQDFDVSMRFRLAAAYARAYAQLMRSQRVLTHPTKQV